MTLFDAWLEPEHFPTWRRRLRLEWQACTLTLHRREALAALLTFVGDAGLFPSDAAVAERAMCSARTVRRARADARELGLLTWQRRRKLVNGRWRQGSNDYTVHIPARPVCSRPDGQDGRGVRKKEKKEANGIAAAEKLGVPIGFPSLAEIAQRRQGAILEAWQSRRSLENLADPNPKAPLYRHQSAEGASR